MAFCITIAVIHAADKTWSPKDFDSVEVWPTRPPTQKEAADSGVTLKEAMNMPWFPTHEIYCSANGRLCRPGEGNLKGYRFWGQPYIHRESYVQSRHRTQPHEPNPQAEYSKLATLARRVQKENLVMMAAADWDFRRIILNWIIHVHRLGYTNALVLSMDAELHADLRRRGLPSFDNSANLDAWNTTCLQRHVQRVRTERVLAVAALVAAGLDVLHMDATVILVQDVLPSLRAAAAARVDMMAQRHECPPNVERHTGSGVNPGFLYVRAARADALVPFFKDAVQRGLVEFYHRWDNVIDHFGFTFLFDENDLSTPTSKLSNETTIFNLRRPRGCQPGDPHEQSPQGCLRAGFFPHDQFPRFGSWPLFRATARVHHIVQGDAALGPEHAEPPGVKPSRGPRQRLDRYDDKDFDDYEDAMRAMGLWKVDDAPEYHGGAARIRLGPDYHSGKDEPRNRRRWRALGD